MNKNFELKIMATNWGFDGTTDAFCAKVKKEGYDGIEIWWPADNKKDELFAALKAHGLEVGFLCGGFQNDPKEHLEYYKTVSYTHLRAHETGRNLVCRLLLEKKK